MNISTMVLRRGYPRVSCIKIIQFAHDLLVNRYALYILCKHWLALATASYNKRRYNSANFFQYSKFWIDLQQKHIIRIVHLTNMKLEMIHLHSYAMPFFVVFIEGQVNWDTAQSLCRTRYDSQLIPGSYIEEHNLTLDIIQELKPGVSAWIDGKIQNLGCNQEKCLKIKKILQQKDRKLPYICVNSKGIEINTGYVLYKESEKLCNEDKFSMSFMFYVNELIQRIDQLPIQLSNQTFWIPNVKLTENSDTLCAFVTTRENSLDTLTGNCSIHQLGICINNSYIQDYQLTLMLEMTSMKTTDGDQSNSSVESIPIICYVDVSGAIIWIAVSLTLLVLLSLSIILWKKRLASMRSKKGKLLENEKHLEEKVI